MPAHATTYFVATNGSNTNPGTTTAAPFQTIQHAATNMVAGDTCFIRDGVYRETLAPSRSGISSAPITFGAYSNEVVTLDGADAVTGWTFLSNGIYQASVNWDLGEGCNQVFVDGAMMREAQYPDYGSGDVLHPATVSVTVDSVNTNLITSTAWGGQPDNYWAGAWFLGGVGLSWAWQSARVLSSTGNTITVDPGTETPNWWFTGSGNGKLLPHGLDHLPPARLRLQRPRHILAELAQAETAAAFAPLRRIDHHPFSGKMLRESIALRGPPGEAANVRRPGDGSLRR